MEQNSAPNSNDPSEPSLTSMQATPATHASAPAPVKKKKAPTGWIMVMLTSFALIGTAAVFVSPHILWMFKGKKSASASKHKAGHGLDVSHGDDDDEGEELVGAHHDSDDSNHGHAGGHADAHGQGVHASSSGTLIGKILGNYGHAMESIQLKVDELRRMEHRLAAVELENLRLRTTLERNQFECRVAEAGKHAKESRRRIAAETRTHIGRTLASIDYRIPEHLLPSQLYTLAVSYLHSRDNEKAVKILTHLMTLQDVDSYRNPKDYLLTGVAWYRIDNLEEADRYFAKALEATPQAVGAAMLPYKAQARLWRAIVAERSGKRAKAQYWMRELVDHHPHSKEAQWVNSKEARRAVAGSRKAADEPSHH